jgi:hypothetical protein
LTVILALSQSVTTGLFALAGVIVGGAIATGATLLEKRLDRRAEARQACRLIVLDLSEIKAAVDYVLTSDNPADLGARVDLPEPHDWNRHRETLARVLTKDEWRTLTTAIYSIDFIRDARSGRVDDDIPTAWHKVDQRVVAAHTAIKHRV